MQFQFLGSRKFSNKVEGMSFLRYIKIFHFFWSFFFFKGPQAELLSTTSSDVKYPEVWKFLSQLKLERYYEKLVEEAGCQTIDDILRLDGAILEKIGVLPVPAKKILEAVEELKKGVTFPKTFNLKSTQSQKAFSKSKPN